MIKVKKYILASLLCLISIGTAYSSWMISKNKSFEAPAKDDTLVERAYIKSQPTIKYYEIEKAIEVANSLASPTSIQEVYILPRTDHTISKSITIDSYVNVTLLYDANKFEREFMMGATYANFADVNASYETKNLKNKIILKDESRITINPNASLKLLAQVGRDGNGLTGHTSGFYTQISMSNNTSILVNGGTLDLQGGYIKRISLDTEAKITVVGQGKTYSNLVIYDSWGGPSVNTYFGLDISPFLGFDMPNIHVKTEYVGGDVEAYGYVHIYSDAIDLSVLGKIEGQHNISTPKIIGKTNAVFILNPQTIFTMEYRPAPFGYTTNRWKYGNVYDNSTGEIKNGTDTLITIQGGMSTGPLVISTAFAKSQPVIISTENSFYPISWKYHISLYDGEYNFNTKMKFMTGSTLYAHEDVELNFNKEVIFYNNFTDNRPAKTYQEGYKYPSNEKAASFILNGNLNVNGDFGGNIYRSEGNTSTATVNYGSVGSKVISTEGIGELDTGRIILHASDLLSFANGNKPFDDSMKNILKDISKTTYSTNISSQAMGIDNETNQLAVLKANNTYISNVGEMGFSFPIPTPNELKINLTYDGGNWWYKPQVGVFEIWICDDINKTNARILKRYEIRNSNINDTLLLDPNVKCFYITAKSNLKYLRIDGIDDTGAVYINDIDHSITAENTTKGRI